MKGRSDQFKEGNMNSVSRTHRRSFLGRMFSAAVATSLLSTGTRAAEAQESGTDDWITEVKGTHRCLFDFPQHKNAMPLLHILNYINTYTAAYGTKPGEVGAVGTFYSVGQPSTRNVFNQPTQKDLHLVMQALGSPTIPALADMVPALGIENLQKMGAK